MKSQLDKLFIDEKKIIERVRSVSYLLVDLGDFVISRGPLELSEAEILGKRVVEACDLVNEQVHLALKRVGLLLSHSSSVIFKDKVHLLHDLEDKLSLIHGDIDAISTIAEHFYESDNREVAFENLNKHYSSLVSNLSGLLFDEFALKSVGSNKGL